MPHFEGQLCGDGDVDVFFPLSENSGEAVDAAKAICRMCPARAECRTYAVETRQPFGVWGGTTGEERQRIRRTRSNQTP